MSKEVVVPPAVEAMEANDASSLMQLIRPQWQAKGLIERVRRLLPVDPSSACQRLLNAAIADLREKIKIAGIDIAEESAKAASLPPVRKPDDVDNYSTARIIDLAYHMGLLTRPEWRRMTRAYDIRRDLEHEDSEYEAGVEDLIYIFKTCIEAVLARDPVTLIKVSEVKDLVQASGPAVADERMTEDFEHAPDTRQIEILKFLLSLSLNEKESELVRANAFTVIGVLAESARDSVVVELAKHMQEKVGRRGLTGLEVRVAIKARVYPYLRKAQKKAFYSSLAARLEAIPFNWRSNASHGDILRSIIELGGLTPITPDHLPRFVKWMTLCYLGEPGGYGQGIGRAVFFSNSAAPLIHELLEGAPEVVRPVLAALETDKDVRAAKGRSAAVSRRFDQLLDLVEPS
ncbi:hypothetical protein [Curtobacterium flaccumfaciens]|uniref:hypothetical protein n=1 Tax=Curtobacterium flaccumfaciens TaxID=2035 RepID=UPI003D9A621C